MHIDVRGIILLEIPQRRVNVRIWQHLLLLRLNEIIFRDGARKTNFLQPSQFRRAQLLPVSRLAGRCPVGAGHDAPVTPGAPSVTPNLIGGLLQRCLQGLLHKVPDAVTHHLAVLGHAVERQAAKFQGVIHRRGKVLKGVYESTVKVPQYQFLM